MNDYIIISIIIGGIFALLSLTFKSNREQSALIQNLISLVIILLVCNIGTFIYRNSNSVLGYVLQQNGGLAGGYLCIGITILMCIIWLVTVTIKNKKV